MKLSTMLEVLGAVFLLLGSSGVAVLAYVFTGDALGSLAVGVCSGALVFVVGKGSLS